MAPKRWASLQTLIHPCKMESSTGLLGISPELIDAIFSEIRGSHETFRSLSLVCRRLYALSTRFLYKSVIIRGPANGERFAWTITHCPHLIPLVRELQIHYHETGHDDHTPEDLDLVIANLANLESLVVRSDGFDNRRQTNLFDQPQVLPVLRSCKLAFCLAGLV